MREPNESESAYMKRRFMEAMDDEALDRIDDQLREEGYKVESIRARKSERRQELKKQLKAVSPVKGSPLTVEQIVENLPWPMNVDGEVDKVFVAGMKYEAYNVVRGIRLAQELSKMGIDQATPIIKMAQEMRQTEGQIAKETGLAMGGEIAGRMFDYLDQKLPTKPEAPIQNPYLDMFFRTFQSTMGRLFKVPGEAGPTTPGFVDKRAQKGG